MVVRPRPGLFEILFTLQGSVLPEIAPKVLGIAALACVSVWIERRAPNLFPVEGGIGPFTLIGLALSIFQSFRNTACYDRWWEARRAWGTLIVEVRSLARLVPALLPGEAQAGLRARVLRRTAGFAHALHARLRDADAQAAAAPWLPAEEVRGLAASPCPPDTVLAGLGADLGEALRGGALSDVSFGILEGKVAALSAIQAVCERIKDTPLPFAYTLLLYRTAWLYCLLLPFGLAALLGWATPFAAALVAYTFFGLDALGDELEEPFGLAANDLPLDALLRTVDATVLHALGEPPPPPASVVGYVMR